MDDTSKAQLIENRWTSSSELWDVVERTYKANTAVYENRSGWLDLLPQRRKQYRMQANRVFVDMEAVINSLIANPPGINVLPSRNGVEAQQFARTLEKYFQKKYLDLNIKETFRMGYRNLYFGRLFVIKAFWNPVINDFDFRAIDPRKVRVGKYARKEQDTEFAIEEIEDNLCAVVDRFPNQKEALMKKYGVADDVQLYIKNPDVKYKECWIHDYVIFKLDNLILDTIKNPYWDWDGILITDEEEQQLEGNGTEQNPGLKGQGRRDFMQNIKLQQDQRQAQMVQGQSTGDLANNSSSEQTQSSSTPETTQPQSSNQAQPGYPVPPVNPQAQPGQPEPPPLDDFGQPITPQSPTPPKYKPYFFNYFDTPRKPYIFATIFNNENTPIGRTDMITLSAELQRGIDKRKMDIDENCEFVNGMLKVDASVMDKANASRIRFETKGVIWGKGVKDGVTREVGQSLPAMVFEDMQDSRAEIDNIMAATSAMRGEQQGVETKAGRLALVQQSYLRLNELVQVGDYIAKEVFSWGMQMAKSRYTEYHYAKWMGKQDASDIIEIIQDDFETGSEVTIIAGKTLPEDDEFKWQQAQDDVKSGYISPIDYLEIANYNNAKELAKNAFLYKVSPFSQFDITDEERMKIPAPLPQSRLTERIDYKDMPPAAQVQWLGRQGITITEDQIVQEGTSSPVAIAFKDLPPDGQVQAAAKLGITLDPHMLVAEKIAQNTQAKAELDAKNNLAHAQTKSIINPPVEPNQTSP